MSNEDFDQVEPGSLLPSVCSPAIEDDLAFHGIRIAAPTRTTFSSGGRAPRLMICGGYQLPAHYAGLGASLEKGVWLVASDIARDRAFVEPAVNDLGEPAEEEREAPTIAPAHGAMVLEYFNVDIGARFPREEGVWFVFALIGDEISNVVKIDLVRES